MGRKGVFITRTCFHDGNAIDGCANSYMYMHLHICLRKRSHYDATVIKPDRNQHAYSKNGYYNFHRNKRWPSGQGLGLRGRGFDPYSSRHEHCVLEQGILLSKSTGNTKEAVVPSRHD